MIELRGINRNNRPWTTKAIARSKVLRSNGMLVCLCCMASLVMSAQDFDYNKSFKSNEVDPGEYESMDDAFIGVGGGASFPLGQFKSKDYRNYFAGYAENGYQITLFNGHQKFGKHFGVGINWYRSQFAYDHASFTQLYEDAIDGVEFVSSVEGDWILHGATGNAIITIPHEVFDIDVRLGAGFGRATRPEINIEGYEDATGFLVWSWKQEQVTNLDLILGFGMNARIHVYKGLDLLFQWDYQRMTTTFEISNIYAGSVSVEDKLEQQFEVLNIGAGLGLRIN